MASPYDDLVRLRFGDSPEMAEELLAVVLEGEKTATTWAVAHGTLGAEVGKMIMVQDSQGRDRAVVLVTDMTQRRYNQMTDPDFARAEGEGDRSLAHWREVHEAFFTRLGVFAPDMPIWCTRFRLIEAIPLEAGQ